MNTCISENVHINHIAKLEFLWKTNEGLVKKVTAYNYDIWRQKL